jgi:polyferredoxin
LILKGAFHENQTDLQGASSGIVSGSLVVFGLLFVSSLFFGRLFCGWVCPAAGLQEIALTLRKKAVNRKKIRWIKYLVWGPWILSLIFFALQAGGFKRLSFFYMTRGGLSITDLGGAVVLGSVLLIFFVLAISVGRRGACHTICWMAPFMIIGRRVRNLFGWPSLRLEARNEDCIKCGRCTRSCPMSIGVMEGVRSRRLETTDCVLCGSCVDNCPKDVIRYTFAREASSNLRISDRKQTEEAKERLVG